MKYAEFKERNQLETIDPKASKVTLGYFAHTVSSNDETVEAVTLSKDLSLYISQLSPEQRRKMIFSLVRECELSQKESKNPFHLIAENNNHLLVTYTDLGDKKLLHIEQRG